MAAKKKAAKPKMTEAQVMDLLRDRVMAVGPTGAQAALIPHVRAEGGLGSARTIDAVGIGFWQSRGMMFHGYEIKCSRADWRKEIQQHEKAEAFIRKLDYFSLVVSDESFVYEGELPPTWGLLVIRKGKLVEKVKATYLHEDPKELPPGITRAFVMCLVRAQFNSFEKTTADALLSQYNEGIRRGRQEATWDRGSIEQRMKDAEETIKVFEKESGISLSGWRALEDAATVGKELKLILAGEQRLQNIEQQLDRLIADARRLGDFAEKQRDSLKDGTIDDRF